MISASTINTVMKNHISAYLIFAKEVKERDNSVLFERGGEIYIHPFNAVLFIEFMEDQGDDYIEIHPMAKSEGEDIPRAVIVVLVVSILFLIYRIRSKK